MILKELINAIGASVNAETYGNDDVFPTDKASECHDGSVLFIYRRVGGGYSTDPENIPRTIYAIVCEYEYDVPDVERVIRVSNPRVAYAYACYLESGSDNSEMRLIAVTGTNGKTTTATLIYEILNKSDIKCGYIGTGKIRIGNEETADSGYSMTTPDPDLLYPTLKKMEKAGCRAVVLEISSHAIALGKIAPLKFEYGIFTNLSHEHMDFHKSVDEYYKTKLSLFTQCKRGIFNVDDAYGEMAAEACSSIAITLGIINRGDNYCTDISFYGTRGSEFLYHKNGAVTKVSINLPGAFNVYNASLAMCCAINMGVSPKSAKDALASIDGVSGRMEIIHESPTVIIDYAHTPYAMECVMKALRASKRNGRLITVFGCGGCRDRDKRPLMGRVADKYSDIVIITEDNSRAEDPEAIFKDIISGMTNEEKRRIIPKRDRAIEAALDISTDNDTIVLIGKGHERYIIDESGYHDFDEREVVRNYFVKNAEKKDEN